jgi:nicotinamide riboside transporter PnuC
MIDQGLPWWNWALQGAGLASSYVGAELNSRLDIRGFHVWIISNVTLVVVHAVSGLWLLCLLDVAYFWINLQGILRWRKVLSDSQYRLQTRDLAPGE